MDVENRSHSREVFAVIRPIRELVCRALDGSRLKDCADEVLLRRFVAARPPVRLFGALRRLESGYR